MYICRTVTHILSKEAQFLSVLNLLINSGRDISSLITPLIKSLVINYMRSAVTGNGGETDALGKSIKTVLNEVELSALTATAIVRYVCVCIFTEYFHNTIIRWHLHVHVHCTLHICLKLYMLHVHVTS